MSATEKHNARFLAAALGLGAAPMKFMHWEAAGRSDASTKERMESIEDKLEVEGTRRITAKKEQKGKRLFKLGSQVLVRASQVHQSGGPA